MQTMELEASIAAAGREISRRMQGAGAGLFDADFWQAKLMEWVMRDPEFKVDLFRFVDVLPALTSTEQVAGHIREYLLRDGRELPAAISTALKAAVHPLTAGVAARTIRGNVTAMGERFMAGNTPASAVPVLRKLHSQGIAFTVDLLGEATISEKEAHDYADKYLALIDQLSAEAAAWPADPVIDRNHLGAIPRVNVSVKVSALDSQLMSTAPESSAARLAERLRPLLQRARDRSVFLNLDLEQWDLHDVTYLAFERLAMDPAFRDWPHMGIVVQAYLRESREDVERLAALARERGAPLTVRLVKGAYWDFETVRARQFGLPCPVFEDKAETDLNYEALSTRLLEQIEHLHPAFGSHNLRSVSHAIATAQSAGIPDTAYEIQVLYGMAEAERAALRSMGHRVRVYAPVGEFLPGIAYLVRRLLENTANSGFLRLSHHENKDLAALLARPAPAAPKPVPPREFETCAFLDFTSESVRQRFQSSVDRVRAALPAPVPVVINGKRRTNGNVLEHSCPSETSRIAARVTLATVEEADSAVRAAMDAWPAWRDRPLEERAAILDRLGAILERDRYDLAAWMVWEVGKPWAEADGEVAEAIDYCRYYAHRARIELAPHDQGSLSGEDNQMFHEGRGVAAIIAPWNFPLAILCGMATAALVAGNTAVLKPAEQSSAIALALFDRLLEAGFPPGVVHLVPGIGEDVGARLVADPQVAVIAFTGSKNVGLAIGRQAGITVPGQPQVKRVVCEMGGKNAIIVDADADWDEAVSAVVKSAFGYAGQKCSACSRVIVVDPGLDGFAARLVEASRSIGLHPSDDPACKLGPLIDQTAFERVRGVMENPGPGARLLYRGEGRPGGWFLGPAIFAVDDPKHRLLQEEFFGPVLALIRARSFDEAIAIANGTEYALTGAVFSRTPSHLEKARRGFRVGNLYLNRGSTGAIVYRQPFGGFKMSGLGSKAGGPGYLHHFTDARVITENTMRRGFTPEVD